jgi:hypothetical protein
MIPQYKEKINIGGNMAIFRKHKVTNYTSIDNGIFKNPKLSYKATGLLCLMLSLPDGWDFTIEGLEKMKLDNKTSIRTGLKELEENGYLVRTRERNEKGVLLGTIYDIYEQPKLENQTQVQPKLEKPTLEKPTLENRTQLNTNIIKDLNNKKENIKRKFERFYLEYPKKVKKYDVEKWFTKNKPDDDLFNQIMSALKKFKKTEQWQTKQFIPYPTTWLNQKRWEDEIETKESVLEILERLEKEDEQKSNKRID